MKLKSTILATLAITGLGLTAQAGTFANITIDGDFSDWNGIPIYLTDADESFAFDINTIQIANNETDVFFRVTFFRAVNPNSGNGLFLGIDNDNNLALSGSAPLGTVLLAQADRLRDAHYWWVSSLPQR